MRAAPRESIIVGRPTAVDAKARWALLLAVAAVVFLADRISKYLVVTNLAVGEMWNPIPVLRPFVTVTHVTNTGAAFGLFRDYGLIFAIVDVVVVVGIIAFYRFLPPGQAWLRVSLGLQLGGALGNLCDRVGLGSVVDFVDFKIWPVFNLADLAVVVGVSLLAFHLLFDQHEGEQTAEGMD
jgi:signal peptidase II